jgi:hypothetical protein
LVNTIFEVSSVERSMFFHRKYHHQDSAIPGARLFTVRVH